MAMLSNRLILVVEDEMLIMMEIEDALADAGCTLLIASRVSEAMALAETEAIDCAFLDVSVAGEDIYPVAKILSRRNIPLFFPPATVRPACRPSIAIGRCCPSHTCLARSATPLLLR